MTQNKSKGSEDESLGSLPNDISVLSTASDKAICIKSKLRQGSGFGESDK